MSDNQSDLNRRPKRRNHGISEVITTLKIEAVLEELNKNLSSVSANVQLSYPPAAEQKNQVSSLTASDYTTVLDFQRHKSMLPKHKSKI